MNHCIYHCMLMRILGGPATGDQKSTSGCVLALEGDNSFAMLGWGSRTQKVVSRSTTEAEFVSLSAALFSEAIPCQELWQSLIPGITLKIHEDNSAVLAIISKGYSPQLRHLSKTHRINVASTCDVINDSTDVDASYIDTNSQRADIMTKGLSNQKWLRALELLKFARETLDSLPKSETK